MVKTKVKPHTRISSGGRKHNVKPHSRKPRKRGKKVTFKKVGTFFVAHDESGNFRGSKVVPFKKAKKTIKRRAKPKPIKRSKPQKKTRVRKRLTKETTEDLHTQFFKGEISAGVWLNKLGRI